jgi:hypothetical protein
MQQIDRLILEIYKLSQIYECRNWETEHYISVLEIRGMHRFWEYRNGNQTFILDSHQPFICNVYLRKLPPLLTRWSPKNARTIHFMFEGLEDSTVVLGFWRIFSSNKMRQPLGKKIPYKPSSQKLGDRISFLLSGSTKLKL